MRTLNAVIAMVVFLTRLNDLFSQTAGTLKWSAPIGASANGSPALDTSGNVYITATDGKLYSIDSSSGSINPNWPVDLHNNGGNTLSSPAAGADGTIYVNAVDTSLNNYLYAINQDGSFKWSSPVFLGVISIQDPNVSTAAIGYDGTIYTTEDDGLLSAVDPSGTIIWSQLEPNANAPEIDCAPIIGPDCFIYFWTGDGHILGISADGGQIKRTIPLSLADNNSNFDFKFSPILDANGILYIPNNNATTLDAINYDNSTRWSFPIPNGAVIESTPVINANGTIYVCATDGNIYAVNTDDGSEQWAFQTDGAIYSSPAVASDGTIYVTSSDGYLYALNPDKTQKWPRFQSGGPIYSSPVIGEDGTVYFGSSDGKVYAIYGSAPSANSGWPTFGKDVTHTSSLSTGHCGSCFGPGIIDATFNPIVDGAIYDVALDSNGNILIAGGFTHVDGQPRQGVARLKSDGTLDTGFDASTVVSQNLDPGSLPYCVASDSLGRVYIGGDGALIRVTDTGGLIATGDYDQYLNGFVLDCDGGVYTISGGGQPIQIDSSISENVVRVGGYFTEIGGEPNTELADIWVSSSTYPTPDGIVDSQYDCLQTDFGGAVESIVGSPGNNLIVAGDLETFAGDTEIGYGTFGPQTTPNLNGGADSYVWAMALQPDGKVVVGGDFGALGTDIWYTHSPGSSHYHLGRFNADGTVDNTFNPTVSLGGGSWDDDVQAILLQLDGQIIVAGGNIEEYYEDGAQNASFSIPVNGTVSKMVQQPDGQIIAVGSFTTVDGQAHQNMVRFHQTCYQ